MDTEQTLRNVPLFKNLQPKYVKQLAKWTTTRTYEPGQALVVQGQMGMGLYCLQSGRVQVTQDGPNGPRTLRTMGSGDVLGELSLIGDQPRSATVTAEERTTAVLLDKAQFLAEMKSHPEIALEILPILVRRLAEAEARTQG